MYSIVSNMKELLIVIGILTALYFLYKIISKIRSRGKPDILQHLHNKNIYPTIRSPKILKLNAKLSDSDSEDNDPNKQNQVKEAPIDKNFS